MSFNVQIVPQTPAAPVGSNPKNKTTKTAEAPVVRPLPSLTQFNPETKLAEDVASKLDGPPAKTKVAPGKDKLVEADKESRHQAWQKAQDEKRQAHEDAKAERATKKQGLAKDYLQQGNFHKAAEALGLSVPELLTLTQNAALSIPTPAKELSAEEKKAQELADYRRTTQAELEENRKFRYQTVADNYIRENIKPLLSDTERFPLLNQNKDNLSKLQMGIYEFLNKEYNDTCQWDANGKLVKEGSVPSIEAILDTLETQTERAITESLDKVKGVKKFAKYFQAPTGEIEQVQEQEEEQPEVESKQYPQYEEEEELDEEPNLSVKPKFQHSTGKVPFALMSLQDKVKEMERQRKAKKL